MLKIIRMIRLLALSLVAVGCNDAAGPGADGSKLIDKTCATAEVPSLGSVSTIPTSSKADLCLRIPAGTDRYFLAFADVRSIERARTAPEDATKDEDFTLQIRGVKSQILTRTDLRSDASAPAIPSARYASFNQLDIQCDQNPLSPTCRSTPWQIGEQFKDPRGFTYSVLNIEGPLVLAVEQTKFDAVSASTRVTYAEIMKRLVSTHLPLLKSVFGGLSVTSTGSQQTLLLLGGSTQPHAVITSDVTTSRGYVESAFATQPDTFSVFQILAHELTHLEQLRYAWELNPTLRKQFHAEILGYWGVPFWASEGGADFLACEAVREEAGVPWAANFEVKSSGSSVTKQYSVCLRNGAGDFSSGYSSGAKYLRTLTETLVSSGASVSAARREVSLGSLEGWFGIDEANLRFTGLTKRVNNLTGSSFDPAISILETAMQTALDDIAPASKWNVRSTLNAWKYWPYHNAMLASSDTIPAKVFDLANGSGYLIIDADATAEHDVRISVPFTGMRWMIAREVKP
jgi:hypothetical protein